MIPLARDRTTATINAKYRNPDRVEHGIALIEGFLTGDAKFYKNGFWKLAKDQLKAESHGKCGFCETPTTAVYFGDVEHFRPKQREMYWWLAYSFDNYLFSCRICNGFKSDQFPILGDPLVGPTIPNNPTQTQLRAIAESMTPNPLDTNSLADFDDACMDEGGVLPNPYQEDPWVLFKWEAIDALQEVNVTHRSAGVRVFVEPTIEILHLNRDALRAQRYQAYATLKAFKEIFEISSGDIRTIAENAIKSAMQVEHQYCGMARYFVAEEWQLAITVPD